MVIFSIETSVSLASDRYRGTATHLSLQIILTQFNHVNVQILTTNNHFFEVGREENYFQYHNYTLTKLLKYNIKSNEHTHIHDQAAYLKAL